MTPFVTLVVAGALVPWTIPPLIVDGHVLAPLASLRRVATRSAVVPAEGTIVVERAPHACTFRLDAVEAHCDGRTVRLAVPAFTSGDGTAFVPLADLARALGGSVAYDARSHTIAVAFPAALAPVTATPYVPPSPAVAPTVVFTPEPPSPTPRAVATGSPRPRRTAIPATPSLPLPASSP